MTIEQALQYIHSFSWKGSVPGLSRISALLELMGHPERTLRFVHVTGTNGKGSTCAMLASMLQCAGYRTGLYTSPYLIRFHERIQIDGEMISDRELCDLTEQIRPLADSLPDHPTEFELVTAIGFAFFARRRCDVVVCEVGMGGEFDATNVILPPEAAVICSIGLDHTEVLGDTPEKIAATKAGIVKPGCDCVLYGAAPSVEAVVAARCRAVGAALHRVAFDEVEPLSRSLDGQVFSWKHLRALRLPLLGAHQLRNAAVALTTAEVLRARGWALTDEAVRRGIETVRWPGRFEILRRDPLFIIDGGHNPQCIEALVQNIRDYLPGRPLTVLTGVLADKDYACMYRSVAPFARAFVTVTPDSPRAMDARALADFLRPLGKPVTACGSADEGVRAALARTGRDGAVLCFGSLYMIGSIEAALARTDDPSPAVRPDRKRTSADG